MQQRHFLQRLYLKVQGIEKRPKLSEVPAGVLAIKREYNDKQHHQFIPYQS